MNGKSVYYWIKEWIKDYVVFVVKSFMRSDFSQKKHALFTVNKNVIIIPNMPLGFWFRSVFPGLNDHATSILMLVLALASHVYVQSTLRKNCWY